METTGLSVSLFCVSVCTCFLTAGCLISSSTLLASLSRRSAKKWMSRHTDSKLSGIHICSQIQRLHLSPGSTSLLLSMVVSRFIRCMSLARSLFLSLKQEKRIKLCFCDNMKTFYVVAENLGWESKWWKSSCITVHHNSFVGSSLSDFVWPWVTYKYT